MKCVRVGGALLRVDSRFDETPGSEDMLAAAELVEHMSTRRDEPGFVTRHPKPGKIRP